MCAPCVMNAVQQQISRRGFLGMAAGAAAVAAGASGQAQGFARHMSYANVRDLSHVMSPQFPVFPGFEPMKVTNLVTVKANGFYVNRIDYGEHTGTHMDAPSHFIDGGSNAENIPPERLIAPLAVIHIHDKAAKNEDAQLTVDDILAWERKHGLLPKGSLVAMHSGWESRLGRGSSYVNADASGVLHFPGFHPEAADFLVGKRDIVGIAVDTLSQDFGASKDFKTHVIILGSGKYGLENVANLANVPQYGATVVVGGPMHKNASGGPSRILAVW